MEEYSSTSYHSFGDSHEHIISVLKHTEKMSKSELLKEFTKNFYYNFPMNKSSDAEYKNLAELAYKTLGFIEIRKDELLIDSYHSNAVLSNGKSTIIQICCGNKPFLVDSMIMMLKKMGIKVFNAIHPVINIERGASGKISNILNKDYSSSTNRESIIILHIQYIDNEAKITQLISRLKSIVADVDSAVSDWKLMLAELNRYTSIFNKNASIEDVFDERREFLTRLEKEYFVFLGSVSYVFNNGKMSLPKDSGFGIIKRNKDEFDKLIRSTAFSKNFFSIKDNRKYIEIGKLNKPSTIHRDANLDFVCIKSFDVKGQLVGATIFVGLFTSILYYQSVTLIPLIRRKARTILKKLQLSPSSHSGKEIISIMEVLPRDELFQIPVAELEKVVMEVFALIARPKLRVFIKKNENGRFVNCMILLPTKRVDSSTENKIKEVLNRHVGRVVTNRYMRFANSDLSYYYIILDIGVGRDESVNIKLLEKELDDATNLWTDLLKRSLIKELGLSNGEELYHRYQDAFPISYQDNYLPNINTLHEIYNVQNALEKEICFNIHVIDQDEDYIIQLKIYSHKELALSGVMPIIQNMGFNVQSEHIYKIKPSGVGAVWMHDFRLTNSQVDIDQLLKNKESIEETMIAVWKNIVEDDSYNKLIISAGLVYREVFLLRAFSKYLCQVGIGYSKEYLGAILTKYPDISGLIIDLFYSRFDPSLTNTTRERTQKNLDRKIQEKMSLVVDNIEDRILRRYIELINHTMRTNFFVKDKEGKYKQYISLKFDSANMPELPLPRPMIEIFVYSSRFEAVHLRSGKVARGGLRWSDRTEDFRTEILGLMKAQVAKNSVIVPVGSKGGFVVNAPENISREELSNYGKECYKNFLRGMLDITDNVVEDKVIHPKQVVILDDKDPYLVVAADKGTALFSDIANSVAKEYNFWLGDAFASGGSDGYDHKKMGITAKGAWVSVQRHFNNIGIDTDKDDFTCVGVGDMFGDVFGNGMLLSKHIKLIAAFNHMHIFIDPNPNAAKSFKERHRMFNLKRSTWKDYSKSTMSRGGMVYARNAKSLNLSKEIKARFAILADKITPDELIIKILKLDVDLLWNGGIGTYVKSKSESNNDVGDKANDPVRVNGEELRCKVVGEGGNLGLTQLGRIEYALNGGRINTDAIDNSAGVDCSDHEVNIKIALDKAVKSKRMNLASRNKILENMEDEVIKLVLRDNYMQTLALTISDCHSMMHLESQERFIETLEKDGLLNRDLEGLPSKPDIAVRHGDGRGLTRPENSVLLAYSKIGIYNKLLESNLADDPYFYNDLLLYFPETMRSKLKKEIEAHPLRSEIIVNAIANSIVNRIDPYFMHLTAEDTGHSFSQIAKAYIITREIFNMRSVWREIASLYGEIVPEHKIELYVVAKKFIMRSTAWLLRNYPRELEITEVIEEFQKGVGKLMETLDGCISGASKNLYEENLDRYLGIKIPRKIAKKLALLCVLTSAYNITHVSNDTKIEVTKVAEIYYDISDKFNFAWLLNCAEKLPIENSWQRLSIRALKDDLFDKHRKITLNAVRSGVKSKAGLEKWYKARSIHINRYLKIIREIQEHDFVEFSMIDLTLKRLGVLIMK